MVTMTYIAIMKGWSIYNEGVMDKSKGIYKLYIYGWRGRYAPRRSAKGKDDRRNTIRWGHQDLVQTAIQRLGCWSYG